MYERLPNGLVWGYHGTSDKYVAEHLRCGIPRSSFPGDWLGHGSYFWEGDPNRAFMWGEERVVPKHGGKPAVLAAVIDLNDCLDLTQIEARQLVRAVAQSAYDELSPEKRASLKQTYGWREMDCMAIEYILEHMVNKDGSPRFSTVRGAFQEGDPIYEVPGGIRSHLYDRDHIQINVIDSRAIVALRHVDL